MIKVRVRVSSGTSDFAVVICAESLRHATERVRESYPGSAVGIAFPIEPDYFFAEENGRRKVAYFEEESS